MVLLSSVYILSMMYLYKPYINVTYIKLLCCVMYQLYTNVPYMCIILYVVYYLGMLFLGGGRASLRRSDPVSTACLLISILPRYPNRTIDNQFHLQPLRHMYTLAVEKRALSTVDIDSDNSVSLIIEVYMKSGEVLYKVTPCLLPEMNDVKRVVIPACIPSYSLSH